MLQYILKRMVRAGGTLVLVLSIVFSLLRLMPEEGYFPNYDKMTEAQVENSLIEMGLRDPLPVQLTRFFSDLLKGDLGDSRIYRANVPVSKILSEKIPISARLGVLSLITSLALGIPLGIMMANYRGKFFDRFGTLFIIFVQAVPAAVYYLYIQLYGTQFLGVGMLFRETDPLAWVLPVLSMAMGNTAYYAMWIRRYMIDEMNKDYVKLARAKGMSKGKIMTRHVFRNAFVPLVQYIPSSFLNTVIGSIYIESLYSIPGMGGLLVNVVKLHDNAMVQGIVLVYATVGVIGLIVGDILMALIDPRISLHRKGGERA